METARMAKGEGVVRGLAISSLLLTACLVLLDTQTKVLFFSISEKATYKDMNALSTMVYVDFIAAGYNMVQLFRCFKHYHLKADLTPYSSTYLMWISLFLDQAAVYTVFGANAAATAASTLAVTGAGSFQWMKVCSRFTSFCYQIGGSLVCGYAASLLMAIASSISAFNLFTRYSPEAFLLLKPQTH